MWRRPSTSQNERRRIHERRASRHRLRRASDRAGHEGAVALSRRLLARHASWSAASPASSPITYPPNAPLSGAAGMARQGRPRRHRRRRSSRRRCSTAGRRASRSQLPLRRAAHCSARTWRRRSRARVNDWIAKEWLDRDPRLRASIVVPTQNVEYAVDEIERCAKDRRFVQILVLAMQETPLGRRRHWWPIYAAAERHGLPIGIHPGSSLPPVDDLARLADLLHRGLHGLRPGVPVAARQPDLRGRFRQVSRAQSGAAGVRA